MTIGKDFSNYFNTHLKNGNVAKWCNTLGQTAMSIGLIGLALKGNNGSEGCCHHHHNNSVFHGYMNTGCGGYVGRQFLFGGIGFSQHLINNPMDILGCQCGGYASDYGMLNSYMGGGYINPYAFPIMQMIPNAQFNPIEQMTSNNAPDAGKVDANQDTSKGQAFSDFLKNRVDENDNLVDGSLKLFDKTDNTNTYIAQMSDTAKSYAALIDQNGNKDGYVTKEEYVAFKTKGITDAAKLQQMKALAENEFDKMNLNNNQFVDWKELGTMMAYMDSAEGKGNDSTITAKEFAQWNSQITNADDNYRNNSQTIFKNLFSDQ